MFERWECPVATARTCSRGPSVGVSTRGQSVWSNRKWRGVAHSARAHVVAFGVLVAAALAPPIPSFADPAGFSDLLVVSGLQLPTAFAFLPGGDILVAQRGGAVRRVRDGVLDPVPVATVGVSLQTERGLLGIAVDPAFAQNGRFYVYYTTDDAVPVNRVARFTLNGDVLTEGPTPVLDNIPSTTGSHNGGGLSFGPDGKLYVAVGDDGQRDRAQLLNTLSGKILRINADGSIPSDNPFVGTPGARGEIWHYGLRNPFRFTFHPSGRLFIGDVGQADYEEIDVAEPTEKGLNFGWPCREGLHEGPEVDPVCEAAAVDPIHEYPHAGASTGAASITVGAVAGMSVYPAPYAGSLFFADFVRDFVHALSYDAASGSASVTSFGEDRHTVVNMVAAPDGRIYYASLGLGEIRKIVHQDFPELTPLTVTAAIAPGAAQPRAHVVVTALVSTNNPNGLTVTADLTGIGGLGAQPLVDDGTSGDAVSGDLTFSWRPRLSPGLAPGSRTIPVQVTDSLGRSATTNATLVVQAVVDADADGLPDLCEVLTGLDPTTGASIHGSAGDFDNDGRTNLAECTADTHPRGFFTRLFAEGVSSPFFSTEFALANTRTLAPGQTTGLATAHVLLRFQRSDGVVVAHAMTLPPQTRQTVDVADLAGLGTAEFATLVESDVEVVVDRTVRWSRTAYGGHGEIGLSQPSSTWYFAEGATHSGFGLFYLLQNPNDAAVSAEVTYLLPGGQPPISIAYNIAPQSRRTIWVNLAAPALAATDVSARIVSSQPIVAERAMYRDDSAGLVWAAGHGGAGASAPSTSWFFAEGATGTYFDLYLLLANPSSAAAEVTATYLLPTGTPVQRSYVVAPNSRRTIFVEDQAPELVDTAVSTQLQVTNGVPIVAERAMWWPGPTASSWSEAHSSLGAVATSTRWSMAGGRVGGLANDETYLLVANLSPQPGQVRVRLVLDTGVALERTYNVAASSRRNVPVATDFPTAVGHTFGALIESVGTTPVELIVEQSRYWDAGGVHWAAGTSSLAEAAVSTAATLVIGPGGASAPTVHVPIGGRVRVVNADSTDRWIVSAVPTQCTAITPIGRLRPGESAVSGPFLSAQTCTITDAIVSMGAVSIVVP